MNSQRLQPQGLINIPDLSAKDDHFVQLTRYADLPWCTLSGLPANWLERKITRPRISRYRGATQAALATYSYRKSVVISHAPTMSAAVAKALRAGRPGTRHIAFSFNFTDLPTGKRKDYMTSALRLIDRFVVYSDYEKQVYSDYFHIPAHKFKSVLWTQETPPLSATPPLVDLPDRYLCAVGGEGRDFSTLLQAARLSGAPLVVIARPHSLRQLSVPDNVRVFCNLPLDQTWAIANRSCGVVVPLKSLSTCCGQITVVSAQMLGIPLITNATHALSAYLSADDLQLTFAPGHVDELAQRMLHLLDQPDANQRPAFASLPRQQFRAKYDRRLWATCIEACLDELLAPTHQSNL
jgi:hypothetical protein